MFKRLRNKFLILNMTIISVVLIGALAVIYASTYGSAVSGSRQRLEQSGVRISGGSFQPYYIDSRLAMVRVEETDPDETYYFQAETEALTTETDYYEATAMPAGDSLAYFEEERLIGGDVVEISIGQMTVDDTVSFSVVTDGEGAVLSVRSYLGMSDEAYQSAANQAWANQKDYSVITVEGRDWMYLFRSASVSIWSGTTADGGDIMISEKAEPGRTEIFFLDVTDVNRSLILQLTVTVAVAAVMLVVVFVVSLFFSGRAIKPIALAWDKQRQFIADASHELKTPLTIVSANMDAFEAGGGIPEDRRMWLDNMRQELIRMGKLVGDLLYLAGVEDTRADALPFDLSDAAADAAAAMEAVAYERGLGLETDLEPGLIVKGDAGKLKQAVLVLLDNAVKYSDDGGVIRVSLRRSKNTALLRVANDGPPIPPDDLPRIFDRFYRADPSRSQDTAGYGLGLPIAMAIVRRAGGDLTAESGGGETAFTIVMRL